MRIQLAYGREGLWIGLPEDAPVTVIEPRFVPGLPDERAAITAALRSPMGTPPVRELVQPDDTVAVVFSDLTRPMPNDRVLPLLLDELALAGVPDERIVLINALGTHRAQTEAELMRMLGNGVVGRYRIVQHDAWDDENLVEVGRNRAGRPMRVNRAYMEASVRILTGFIEPHLFAGVSGGPKAVLPGISDIEAIMDNHGATMIADPRATWAVTEGNPIWEEMLWIAQRTAPAFLLNVTLNREREITGVFAGDLVVAHCAGVAFVRETSLQPVPQPFDIVITSNSGYPLDLNLYQSVKGMSAAVQIVRPGGDIVIAAECWDGIPSHGEYRRLLWEAGSPQELLDRVMTPGFRCHDQWEVQVQAQIQLKANVHVYADGLSDEELRHALVIPCHSIEETVAQLRRDNPGATIAVLPEGPQAVPYVERPYQPITPAIVAQLRGIVGEPYVIYDDTAAMLDYAHDEVAGDEYAHMPEAVVKPATAAEISDLVRLANRERIPVTPRGAGSGLSCGAVPVHGGILLSLERMNHILEIDRENMVVVVEPGVVTNDVNEAVNEHGLFYAGYPMSVEMCFVGGNVAENAGGGRAIKYGVTGRYVLGLEVVLPTGEIVQLGGKRVKDVTGYDLLHLMVGSEGTLGIFTRITLRLLPLPTASAVLLIPFADVRSAIGAVPRIMTQGHIVPTSVEFMDRLAVQTAYAYLEERLPHPDIGAMLLVEVDGTSQDQVEAEYNAIVDLCLELGALDVFVGNTPNTERRMWRPRQSMAEALKAVCPVQSLEDIVVPLAQIPDLMPELDRLSQQYDVLMPCYGHAGDGNLHATVVKRPETPIEEWHERLPMILEDLYEVVARLGGTISGEHGIGSKRAHYLPLVMDPTLIALQRKIKHAFDPLNILNPGKIFPPA